MDNEQFDRIERLIGIAPLQKIKEARLFIFGLGGVGSWAAESLARSGVHHFVLVDDDFIQPSNINRQTIATLDTIGQPKVIAMKDRMSCINRAASITTIQASYNATTISLFDIRAGDFVIDAIDTVLSKIELAVHCNRVGAHLFASMGTALKLDPCKLRVADIWETQNCPLARAVRQGLRKRNAILHFPCVYSTEPAQRPCLQEKPEIQGEKLRPEKVIQGSSVAVTASAGLILSSLVIQAIRDS